MIRHFNQVSGQRTFRMEALSDGVFAIAMTIMVFNLQFPKAESPKTDTQILHMLWDMRTDFLALFLSFMSLGIFWVGHTTQFDFIKRTDRHLTWWSIFFLMIVSVVPFTTDILAHHMHSKISVFIYWLNLFAMGVVVWCHWRYAERNGLMNEDIELIHETSRVIKRRIFIAQALYAGAACIAFFNSYLSVVVIALIQMNYALGTINEIAVRKREKSD